MKKGKSLLLGIFLASSSVAFGVVAACGDSVCGYVGGEYVCVVETPTLKRLCSESQPCTVRCP